MTASQSHPRAMIGNIQSLRFLAAMWVALYHIRPPLAPDGLTLLPQAITQMGFMGVDIFFVISGAIMAETTRHLPSGPRPALHFISTRFARIYAGWWPFFVLYWAAFSITGNLREDKNILASFFLWPQNLNHYLLPVTWTLSFELFFYLAVAALLFWNRSKAWFPLMGAAVGIALANAFFWATDLYAPSRFHEVTLLQTFYASPLILEFIAGFLASEFLHRRPAMRLAPWLLALIAFGAAGVCYENFASLSEGGMAGYFHAPERALLMGGFATALVACAVILEKQKISPFPFLQKLGDASYSIYLSHALVISGIFFIVKKSGVENVHATVTVLIVVLGIVLYSVLHHYWIERPLYLAFRKRIDRARRPQPVVSA